MKDVTLKYFASSLPIYIETDALKKGIGLVMLQPDNSVENTSLDYVLVLHHQEGSKMHLCDAISRLSVHDSDAAKSKAEPIADFNISIHEISEITGFKSLVLQDIKGATIKDCQLTKLKTYIVDGFPKHKHECAEDILSLITGKVSPL